MLNDERYDFLQETDLKERLWERMQERLRETALARKEISLDSLGGGVNNKPHPAGAVHAKPAAMSKTQGKSK